MTQVAICLVTLTHASIWHRYGDMAPQR